MVRRINRTEQQTPTLAEEPPSGTQVRVRKSILVLGMTFIILPLVFMPAGFSGDALSETRWLVGLALLLLSLILMFFENVEYARNQPGGSRVTAWLHNPLMAGAMLIIAGMMISMLLAPTIKAGIPVLVKTGFLLLAAACLACSRPSRKELNIFILFLLISMSIQAVLTLLQYYTPDLPASLFSFNTEGKSGRSRMIGSLGNPEYVASWLSAGMSCIFILMVREVKRGGMKLKGPMPIYLIVFILFFLSIFLSGGRGAMLAFLLTLSIFFLAGMHRAIRARGSCDPNGPRGSNASRPLIPVLLITILLLITGLAWISQSAQDRGSSLPSRLMDLVDLHSTSMRHRLGLLSITTMMIAEHPIRGTGPGFYSAGFYDTLEKQVENENHVGWWALADSMSSRYADRTHCDPLQWWAEFGFLPFLGLLWIIIGTLAGSRRYWLQLILSDQHDSVPALPPIWGACLTLGINMWVSFPLQTPIRALTFWVLLGFCGALCHSSSDRG